VPIENKIEIIGALNEKINAVNHFISSLSKEEFEATPEGKWSAGQNLDHLIRSIKPLQIAFMLPKLFLRLLFGRSNRPSKSYDQLVEKYKSKLAQGGKASGPFIPPGVLFEKKLSLLKTYEHQKQNFIKKIKKQKETNLDKYILPHPLLGKLTLREMLFFTIYHNQHHLESLEQRQPAKPVHQSS
jgi:hypothetical protein